MSCVMKKLIIFLVIVFVSGCAPATHANPTPVRVFTESPDKTTSISGPTASVVPTTLPTNTATLVPDPFVSKCVDLGGLELLPPMETADHWLLLREDQAPYPPYLLNLANGIQTPISDKDIMWMYVSPNQQKIAYDTYSRLDAKTSMGKLVVTNTKGEISKIIPREQNWTFFWGWLDDDHLMVTKKAEEGGWVASLVILGLSDNSRQELKSDYPNFDNVNYLPWQHNRVIYDSTLTIALYPSYAEKGSTITFFDLINKKILTEFPAILAFTRQPVWSPDGQYVAVVETTANRGRDAFGNAHYDQELILLDKSGDISRLTHFTDKYTDVQIGNVSWSPNGQFIAFWFSLDDGTNEELAILNLNTNLVANYCVIGFVSSLGNSPKPVWSPDSRIVIVNSRESEEEPEKVIWVDVEYGQGAVMDMGVSVEGWLTTP